MIMFVMHWCSILHVVVCRVAPPDPKTQKKERRDLQASDGVHYMEHYLALGITWRWALHSAQVIECFLSWL